MEHVFASVPSVLDGIEGTNERADAALVYAAWSRCAGEQLRTRAEPIDFSANCLTLAVSDEVWQRHLNGLKPQLIARMKAASGRAVVRSIVFQVCSDALRRPAAEPLEAEKIGKVPPSLEHAAGAIGDKDLRMRFLDAAAGCLARQA